MRAHSTAAPGLQTFWSSSAGRFVHYLFKGSLITIFETTHLTLGPRVDPQHASDGGAAGKQKKT